MTCLQFSAFPTPSYCTVYSLQLGWKCSSVPDRDGEWRGLQPLAVFRVAWHLLSLPHVLRLSSGWFGFLFFGPRPRSQNLPRCPKLRSVLSFDESGAAQTGRISAASHPKVLVCDFSVASWGLDATSVLHAQLLLLVSDGSFVLDGRHSAEEGIYCILLKEAIAKCDKLVTNLSACDECSILQCAFFFLKQTNHFFSSSFLFYVLPSLINTTK